MDVALFPPYLSFPFRHNIILSWIATSVSPPSILDIGQSIYFLAFLPIREEAIVFLLFGYDDF